jgi:hypothetical protein
LLFDEGGALLSVSGLLLDELLAALAENRLLGHYGARASVHFRPLELHCLYRDFAILGAERSEFGRRGKVALTGALREQARALRKQRQIIAGQRALGRAQLGRGKFDQDFTGLDMLSFAHVDCRNHAAVLVLDGLAVAGNGNLARGMHASVERQERGPTKEQHEEQNGHGDSDADFSLRVAGFAVH